MHDITRRKVLLSLQRALLGEITPGMRAISVRWNPKSIRIRVFHDGPWPAQVEEDFDAGAVTQVVADLWDPDSGGPDIDYEFLRLDGDASLPQGLGEEEAFVYARDNTKLFGA